MNWSTRINARSGIFGAVSAIAVVIAVGAYTKRPPAPSVEGDIVDGSAVEAAVAPDPSAATPSTSLLAPTADPKSEAEKPGAASEAIALLGADADAFFRARAAYGSADFRAGDRIGDEIGAGATETAVRWAALRRHPKEAGFHRLSAFLATHPDWPAADWLRKRAEEALFAEHQPDAIVLAWLTATPPTTGYGRFLLARALARRGEFDRAAELAREAWRNDDLGAGFDARFQKEFSEFLTPADYKRRTERLLYAGRNSLALRAAEFVGKDFVLYARLRMTLAAGGGARVPLAATGALQDDPGLLFARIHALNNAKKFTEAAALLRRAPTTPEAVVDGDAWWIERRQAARKALDAGDVDTAYQICAQHAARSVGNRVEAEFMAGWIALRFQDDPARAARHFAEADGIAETPLQKSRALYWRGRAAEAAGGDAQGARDFYARASEHSTTFYGQLAAARLGDAHRDPLRPAPEAAPVDARHEAVRVVEILLATDEADIAGPLAIDAAKTLTDSRQVAALGAAIERRRDAKLSLVFGKQAGYRGFALDHVAFPSYGVPDFEALPGSAARSIVYAIARQESAFDPRAVSSAGAMGLMQMIASTARHTAAQRGVGFDISRMLREPAFNAQLGAAHLGILLGEYRGAYLLTFAAYNAGGGRVKQWIDAYGDPRRPNVDPVDWVERIPIAETRNYVQRVMENFIVYRAKFGDTATRTPLIELARAGAGL